ncbi:MAG: hypothetical protein ACJA0N_000446 [Pseudohongiellaceae bacterium]|jgi:hypothetical protein
MWFYGNSLELPMHAGINGKGRQPEIYLHRFT